MPSALVYVFIFQNILNAGSPYITLTINSLLAISTLLLNGMRFRVADPKTLKISLAILVWLLLIIAYRGDFESQTLLKYVRTTLVIAIVTIFLGAA